MHKNLVSPLRPDPLTTSVQELAAISNDKIVNDLRAKDARAGHWLQEDPPLHTLLNWISTHQ